MRPQQNLADFLRDWGTSKACILFRQADRAWCIFSGALHRAAAAEPGGLSPRLGRDNGAGRSERPHLAASSSGGHPHRHRLLHGAAGGVNTEDRLGGQDRPHTVCTGVRRLL